MKWRQFLSKFAHFDIDQKNVISSWLSNSLRQSNKWSEWFVLSLFDHGGSVGVYRKNQITETHWGLWS